MLYITPLKAPILLTALGTRERVYWGKKYQCADYIILPGHHMSSCDSSSWQANTHVFLCVLQVPRGVIRSPLTLRPPCCQSNCRQSEQEDAVEEPWARQNSIVRNCYVSLVLTVVRLQEDLIHQCRYYPHSKLPIILVSWH